MLHKKAMVFLFSLFLALILIWLPNTLKATESKMINSVQSNWTWPLDSGFITVKEEKYNTTVENTDYGIRNLDLIHPRPGHLTCFGLGWHNIYHAGVDLYMANGNTAGQSVKAVADGIVKYRDDRTDNVAVIIEHPNYGVWSVYWHLTNLQVSVGSQVSMGEVIGDVWSRPYDGRFPDIHPFGTDDSHLHFEIRTFEDGSNLFPDYPNCNGRMPGAGYTYPELPSSYGYLDPIEFIRNQMLPPNGIYLPLIIKDSSNYSECQPSQNLLLNRGFEESTIEDPIPWIEVTTNLSPTGHIVQTSTVYLGEQSASFGDWFNTSYALDEELPQSFVIPAGTTSAVWEQTIQITHTNGTSLNPDDYFIFELNNSETGLTLLNTQFVLTSTSIAYPDFWYRFTINIPDIAPLAGQPVSASYSAFSNPNSTATRLIVDDIQFVTYCANLDTFEPNDTFNRAYDINPDETYTSYIWSTDDIDWYKFDVDVPVNKERLVEVGLENIPANANYNLAIYDSRGTELDVSENSGNNDETILVIANQNETYHIKVYPVEGTYSQNSRYKLWVQVGSLVIP